MKKSGAGVIILLVLGVGLMMSCGGTTQETQPAVQMQLTPSTITLDQGAKQQFSAIVTGAVFNRDVTWSVVEPNSGSIDSNGLYTAPATSGTFHVTAVSQANEAVRATATITVRAIQVTVLPGAGDMEPGTTQQFTATVTGTAIAQTISWTVAEGGAGGSITSNGLYTAPAAMGTYHVRVDISSGQTQVVVPIRVASLGIVISPRALGLMPGERRVFTADITGSLLDFIEWSVVEGSAGGTITTDGEYYAPTQTGTYHVNGRSVDHPSVSGTATVTVTNSGFTILGETVKARSWHTATLLANGDVLLVGGQTNEISGEEEYTATAEVYDHVTGKFSAVGSMVTTIRASHTATLLPDGRVLVSGGNMGDWWAFKSAEIYDPATTQFSATGDMMMSRMFHTATLLGNGKVLIAGGVLGWMEDPWPLPDYRVAELYDPATGQFTPTGSMSQIRAMHTATLLGDGRVLIAGGTPGSIWEDGIETAELYDPSTGQFTDAGTSVYAYAYSGGTLLSDGRVLLTGGAIAGEQYTVLSNEHAHIYNPATLGFAAVGPMAEGRSRHTSTLLPNHEVLLVGGDGTDGIALYGAELFDAVTSSFQATGSMIESRRGHTATLLRDGRVLVTGGYGARLAEIYTPRP